MLSTDSLANNSADVSAASWYYLLRK